MKFVFSLTFLLLLHCLIKTDAACSDATLIGQLDTIVVDQLIALLQGSLTGPFSCNTPLAPANVSYWMYTRNNPHNPIIITNPNDLSQVDPTKKLILINHGWLGCPATVGFPEMKDAYLAEYDVTVLLVDWSDESNFEYTKSFCYVPIAAQIVAEGLWTFSQQTNFSPSNVHLVGWSLGAQLGAYIAKSLKTNSGQTVGRLSGLDPAGPGFNGGTCSQRICKTDAQFVDVKHTNAGILGIKMDCGMVDFYPNGGKLQPGCAPVVLSNIKNLTIEQATCDHFRAVYLWTESISSENFKAQSSNYCPVACVPNSFDTNFISMGEHCPANPPQQEYWLPTASSPPYALGCTPYLFGCS